MLRLLRKNLLWLRVGSYKIHTVKFLGKEQTGLTMGDKSKGHAKIPLCASAMHGIAIPGKWEWKRTGHFLSDKITVANLITCARTQILVGSSHGYLWYLESATYFACLCLHGVKLQIQLTYSIKVGLETILLHATTYER
jgi:hypothetical protein